MNPPTVAQLIAQGKTFENRWRRRLPLETDIVLGRTAPLMAVNWDSQISRQHATLRLNDQLLEVDVLPEASNPVFFRGSAATEFKVKPGEHFVIGETTFTFSANRAMATIDVPQPVSQRTFSHQFIRQVRYRDADRRINVLNRLPDVIASAANEEDLMTRMVNTLMAGIATASAIGIVRLTDNTDPQTGEAFIEVKHWDRKSLSGGDFEASESLIRDAIAQQQTILHFWDSAATTTAPVDSGYTFDTSNDWAFACPLQSLQARLPPQTSVGSAVVTAGTMQHESDLNIGSGWAIYVTGKNKSSTPQLLSVGVASAESGELDLEGDIKFCELIASTLKNLLSLRNLERRQSSLRRFFSPAVLKAFASRDPDDVLKPRQCDVSVLFCDLRGFSKTSEALADDLLKLLDQVSQSLGIMTRVILDHGGVIGDFHGDAAMGFWGWPLDQPDAAIKAAQSAIEIRRQLDQFNAQAEHPFEMGIGIGTGRAVAGRIGTDDQEKVTAFGPVVNLASRLESMTKLIGANILLDQATADAIQKLVAAKPSSESPFSVVPLGPLLPKGMQNPVNVFRLQTDGSLTSQELLALKIAVEKFGGGDWTTVREQLSAISADDPTRRLLEQYMNQHPGEDGKSGNVIVMQQK